MILSSLEELSYVRKGKRVIATNGCFDILHVGHIRLLTHCYFLTHGGIVVVGVNDDESVKALKGKDRPVNKIEDRLEVLNALVCVTYVVSFSGTEATEFLRKVRPAVWVKGGDYCMNTLNKHEVSVVKHAGGIISLFKEVKGYSTTGILNVLGQHRLAR